MQKTGSQRFCSSECCKADAEKGYFIIYSRDNFTCIYCGRSSIEDGIKLRLDHIFPRKEGGNDRAINLVTSCVQCNLQKSAKILPDEILERIAAVVGERNKMHDILDNQLIKNHMSDN